MNLYRVNGYVFDLWFSLGSIVMSNVNIFLNKYHVPQYWLWKFQTKDLWTDATRWIDLLFYMYSIKSKIRDGKINAYSRW